jgi:hypothetical protein
MRTGPRRSRKTEVLFVAVTVASLTPHRADMLRPGFVPAGSVPGPCRVRAGDSRGQPGTAGGVPGVLLARAGQAVARWG